MATQKSNSLMVTIVTIIIVLVAFALLFPIINAGSESSPRGFVLPEGNIEMGKDAFVRLGCVSCHTVKDVTFGNIDRADDALIVPLGGTRTRAISYGQLVTSIIHPSESAESEYTDQEGASIMPDMTEEMTVSDMVHIVSFLLEHYDVQIPQYDVNIDPYQPYSFQ